MKEGASVTTRRKEDYQESLIKRSLRYLNTGFPVHFTGPPGVGKTTSALQLAKKRNRPVIFMSGHEDLSTNDLIGSFSGYKRNKLDDNYIHTVRKVEENVEESWKKGRLYEAVEQGHTVIYDEFTRTSPAVNNLFLPVLEERILPLFGTKRTASYIDVHPKFAMIFTSNPLEYSGVHPSQDALRDRMITMRFQLMEEERKHQVLASETSLKDKDISMILSIVSRAEEKKNEQGGSVRLPLMIAKVADRYQMKVSGDNPNFREVCYDILWHHEDDMSDEEFEELFRK